ncbi:hypothetical protein GCM10007981_17980 [Thermocladium modestius]|uniref:Uncharacterized protein n=1 Tax=Thermocladium modestius TaxID=62609 RepID=A0A830GXQ1_9CREN|nr:hypothetical protein [Thermocladium modestius]GGP22334.1 hypothetical protein GCM10007981_17980 [Thermocladium modestius]
MTKIVLCFKKDLSIEINGTECITKVEVEEEKSDDKSKIKHGNLEYVEEKVMKDY